MPLVGASSSHRSEYEPICTTCDNPFTTEENIREISLESLQRSANSRSCEQCELLLRGTVLVFGEEYRKSNSHLEIYTCRKSRFRRYFYNPRGEVSKEVD
ncbi:hypothetical protein B0J14DRAFT_636277 [Halenospora varia]|nr:hypothetical protein B0J14DRAFT_636277 [Halenospora varia]